MKKKLEKQFEKHLDKALQRANIFLNPEEVAEDTKLLKELCIEYLHDFSKLYDGVKFSKEDFQSIVDPDSHNEYHQTIIKDCFKSKKYLSADEVYVYLFTKCINSIGFETKEDYLDKISEGIPIDEARKKLIPSGYVNPTSGRLRLIIKNEKELQEAFLASQNTYSFLPYTKSKPNKTSEYIIKSNNNINLSNQELKKLVYKKTLFHEMSHIFEIQKYENNEFTYKTDSTIHNNLAKLNHPFRDQLADFQKAKQAGKTALFEIINESLAKQVLGTYKIDLDVNQYHNKDSCCSVGIKSNCSYDENLGLSLLYKKLLDDVDFKKCRFNDKLLEDKFNSFFKEEDIKYLTEKYKHLLIEDTTSTDEPMIFRNFTKLINSDNFTPCDIFYTALGSQNNDPYIPNNKYMAQEILLIGFKNKIADKLNNPTTVKNADFYEWDMNYLLKNIDKCIEFPVVYENYKTTNDVYNKANGTWYSLKDFLPYEGLDIFLAPYKDIDKDFIGQLVDIKNLIADDAKENGFYDLLTFCKNEEVKKANFREIYNMNSDAERLEEKLNNLANKDVEKDNSEIGKKDIVNEETNPVNPLKPDLKTNKDDDGADRL